MRKPIDQAPDQRQSVWGALRAATSPITCSELAKASGAHRKSVHDHLRGWIASGHVERGEDLRYRLVRDAGHFAPKVLPSGRPVTRGEGQEQMWRSMGQLGEFSIRDLLAHSTVPISEAAAKTYCGMLLATGYLRVTQKASPAHGRLAVYRLIRNSGPLAPMVQAVKQVWDPNTRRAWQPERQR